MTKPFSIVTTALAPIIWGTTYIVTTTFLPENIPLITAMIRTFPAGVFLVLLCRRLPAVSLVSFCKMVVLAFLNITVFQVLLFVSAYRLPGGLAALLGSIQPVCIMILIFAIDGKRPTTVSLYATGTCILGLSFVVLQSNAKIDTVGVLAAVFDALSMALGVFLTKRWQPSDDVINFTVWQLLLGGAMLVPAALSTESFPQVITLGNSLGFVYLVLFGSVISYTLWFRGITQLSSFSVSVLGALSPLTATILGWLFLGQSLSVVQMIGIVTVLVSVIFIQMQKETS